ncbi:MAG: hypothetical protein K0R70_256 [Steroidobacteraceae bacterium]|nr:hypothetical protein [Steroidobacteraceae bacterium]
MNSHDDERDEGTSVGMRIYWALVSALSAVSLYLTVVYALPRGAAGF